MGTAKTLAQMDEPIRNLSPKKGLKLSIIIPVRNESAILAKTIEHLRESGTSDEIEIIIVDGKSEDGSISIANRKADHIVPAEKACRAYQMHQGAVKSTGDVLVFLHADTQLPKNWKSNLLETWSSDPQPALSAFRLSFDSNQGYYGFMSSMAHFRTKWMTRVPHGDQAIAVSREKYFAAGGFPDVPIMEEYYLARRLKKFGRLHLFSEPVVTSCRRYKKNGPVFNNLRNLFIIGLFYLGVHPKHLIKLYK